MGRDRFFLCTFPPRTFGVVFLGNCFMRSPSEPLARDDRRSVGTGEQGLSEPAAGVEEDADRSVVDRVDVHFGSEHTPLDGNACLAEGFEVRGSAV